MGVFDTGIKFLHVSINPHASIVEVLCIAQGIMYIHEFTQTWPAYSCTILHMLEKKFSVSNVHVT